MNSEIDDVNLFDNPLYEYRVSFLLLIQHNPFRTISISVLKYPIIHYYSNIVIFI